MSKLFISNKYSLVDKNIYQNNLFYKKYTKHSKKELFSVVYEKKNISYGNFFEDEYGNFIAVVGSCIFKNKVGKDAAELILKEFDGNISKLKKEILGLYCIYINKGEYIVVFNDYYGLYDLCYLNDDNGFIIANSLKDISLLCPNLEFDEYSLIQDVFLNKSFDYHTCFKQIYKLKGNEYLKIGNEIEKIVISNDKYKIEIPYINESDSLQYITGKINEIVTQIKDKFGEVSICMTGGLDSRTVLAAFISNGTKVHNLYGYGDSWLTPTRKEDSEIVKLLSDKYKTTLKYMNWNHPESTEDLDMEYQKTLFQGFGFNNNIYAGNRNVLQEFTNGIDPYPSFIEFGYFLEAIRLREWAEKLNRDYFTLDEYINDYYIQNLNEKSYINIFNFKKYLKILFVDILQNMGVNDPDGNISINLFERFRWHTARYSDSRMYFFLNDFTYSFPIFSNPYIHEAILNLPAKVIHSGKFQISLIRSIDSSFLNTPIFSHRRKYRITKNGEKHLGLDAKNVATLCMEKIPILKKVLIPTYRKLTYKNYDVNKERVCKQLKDLDVTKLSMLDIQKYNGNPLCLYTLRQYLIAFNFH